MKLLKLLLKYKIAFLIIILTCFLAGYFFTENVYNYNNARYVYVFNSQNTELDRFLEEAYFESTITKIKEHNEANPENKISYANIDYKAMVKSASLNKEEFYEYSVLQRFFPNIIRSSNGTVNSGDNRVKTYLTLMFSYNEDVNIEFIDIKAINRVNPYMVGGISGLASLILILVLAFIGVVINKEQIAIEDNLNIYKSVFHKSYWKKSAKFISNVRNLCTISVLFALMVLCKFIPIPSGFGGLGLGLTYLVFATIAMIYGPICGLFIGFCSDILGYLLTQGGQVFFIGYTLDAMLTGFIYGVCFYKKKITFANCLIARFFVNIIINVGLGCLWWKIIYNLDFNGYIAYMTLTSLPKNIIYLLPQSILLYIVFKALSKPLMAFNLLDRRIGENISLF